MASLKIDEALVIQLRAWLDDEIANAHRHRPNLVTAALDMARNIVGQLWAALEGQRADTAAAERAYDEACGRISVLERRLAVAEGLIDESRPVVAWASNAQEALAAASPALGAGAGALERLGHVTTAGAMRDVRREIEAVLAEVEPAPAKTPFQRPTLREVSRDEAARISPGLVAAIEARA